MRPLGLLMLGFYCTSKLLVKWRYLLVKPEQCSKKDLVEQRVLRKLKLLCYQHNCSKTFHSPLHFSIIT